MKTLPSVGRVRELLDYDPETGVFTWRVRVARRSPAGSIAGRMCDDRRYNSISVDCVRYAAHRLAWLHYYGEPPPQYIDHIDCNGRNNRISNLRAATKSQNGGNMRRRRNKSLPKGVSTAEGGYRARINKDRRRIALGVFSTPEAASKAYADAARVLFGVFARQD